VIYYISADDYRRGTINTGIGERLIPLLRFYFETGASHAFIRYTRAFTEEESFEVDKTTFKLIDPESRGHYIMDYNDAYRKALLKPGMRIRIFDSYYRQTGEPDDRLSCDGWTGVINYQLPTAQNRSLVDTVFSVTFDEGRGKSNINGEYLIPIV
jgi:hypothetical protein